MSKSQNPWYVLAQLVAVLSGGLFVASGVYAGLSMNFLFYNSDLMKIRLDLLRNNYTYNESIFNEASREVAESIVQSFDLHRVLVFGGTAFIIFALVFFSIGWFSERQGS